MDRTRRSLDGSTELARTHTGARRRRVIGMLGVHVVVLAVLASALAAPSATGAPGGEAPRGEGAPPSAPFLGPAPRWPLPVDAPGALDLHRDCGFTAPLRDGKVLWIFCDTAGVTAAGTAIHPWLDNTAALASVDAPTRTLDVTDAAGRPTQFVDLPASPCPAERPSHRIWPLSATTVPDGPRDQVYVYFEHACGVPGMGIASVRSVGMGLARWTYTAGTTDPGAPVRATVLADHLFDGAWDGAGAATDGGFGRASAYAADDGHLYLYRCHSTWGVAHWGCEVGRVPVGDAASRDAYRFRTAAGTWVPDVALASPVQMGGVTPGSGYQLAWYPGLERWALVGMAWPGIGATLTFRVADHPWGPWSEPTEVPLPEGRCGVTYCYAVYGHPGLDVAGSLAFSFYDPAVTQVQFLRLPVRAHRFWDVPPEHAFHFAIEDLGERRVVEGHPDGSFRPVGVISRQAMAAMVYRWAGAPWGADPGCLAPPAPDVATSDPFCGAIRWMLAEGISEGDPDGGFGPTRPVSRQAAAAFLHRLAGGDLAPHACSSGSFRDVGADHAFCGPITWLVAAGVATGYDDGTFGPTTALSRQAVAAFLHRLGSSTAPRPVAGLGADRPGVPSR